MVEPFRRTTEIERLKGGFLQQSLEGERIISGETPRTIEELQAAREKLLTQFEQGLAVYEYIRRKAQYQRAVSEEVCKEARLLRAETQEALRLYTEQRRMVVNRNKP